MKKKQHEQIKAEVFDQSKGSELQKQELSGWFSEKIETDEKAKYFTVYVQLPHCHPLFSAVQLFRLNVFHFCLQRGPKKA